MLVYIFADTRLLLRMINILFLFHYFGFILEMNNSESEEEMQVAPNANGKVVKKEQPKTTGKEDNSVGKTKVKKDEAVKVEPKAKDEDEDDEDDDDEDDSEDDSEEGSDDEMAMGDSDDEDGDESSEEEEDATPKKAAVSGKKRPAESVTKTPTTEKKAKLVSPAGQKTGGNGKKGAHTATPHPAKGGKTPANADKSKQQTPKSAGSASCKACSKSFNSDNALQAHNKAKHSASK
ncbi:histone deacetylase HDT2-like [Iris pallida]|uniref:Histone deacetylase HDT2-like n=1 Tax=Iris pallida TaxID=29817 RepID=A0AAX6HWY7_IRIPA|nr:histone deacetylase HDT2-like [Iris pallida]